MSNATKFIAATLVAACLCGPAAADLVTGTVMRVTGGDRLVLVVADGRTLDIRLAELDAPEPTQPVGADARAALARKALGKPARLAIVESVSADRVIAHLYVGERWINRELIAEGLAWHYAAFSEDASLAAAEADARGGQRGIWRLTEDPEPPWEVRSIQRGRTTYTLDDYLARSPEQIDAYDLLAAQRTAAAAQTTNATRESGIPVPDDWLERASPLTPRSDDTQPAAAEPEERPIQHSSTATDAYEVPRYDVNGDGE